MEKEREAELDILYQLVLYSSHVCVLNYYLCPAWTSTFTLIGERWLECGIKEKQNGSEKDLPEKDLWLRCILSACDSIDNYTYEHTPSHTPGDG